jgi:hypothetical protein
MTLTCRANVNELPDQDKQCEQQKERANGIQTADANLTSGVVSSKSRHGALMGFARFLVAISRGRARDERRDQPISGGGHLVDCAIESLFVGARGTIHSAQFSDELKRRRANLPRGCRRFEV